MKVMRKKVFSEEEICIVNNLVPNFDYSKSKIEELQIKLIQKMVDEGIEKDKPNKKGLVFGSIYEKITDLL